VIATPTTDAPELTTEAPKKRRRARELRGWSNAFPVVENSRSYFLKGIPPGLARAVHAKCKRDGISRRIVMLQLLTEWVNEPANDGDDR